MAANPALVAFEEGLLGPRLHDGELPVLRRDHIFAEFSNLQTPKPWRTQGRLYLTNLRLVFVAHERDALSGLHSFDVPLASIRGDHFNQPIFGSNNLSGQVLQAGEGDVSIPFTFWFKNGGCGTFLPLYFSLLEGWRSSGQGTPRVAVASDIQATLATAFVDPSDPTRILLAQPSQ